MKKKEAPAFHLQTLSMKDFQKLSTFIKSKVGIKMPEAKRVMVESRLRKRLSLLKLKTYEEYCDYLFSPEGMKEELSEFLDVITTNKTDFFRESAHFQFLSQKALPNLLGSGSPMGAKKVSVWSAACSRGHEPYTLAMVLNEFAETHNGTKVYFDIVGTDISTKVLSIARRAVYDHDEIEPVPLNLRKKYLLRSKDSSKNLVRIAPNIRSKVKFHRLNLMDRSYPMVDQVDIIFCRNVMIYFDRQTQTALVHNMLKHLKKGGYLFVGHSEVLQIDDFPLVSPEITVYQKVG